MKNDWRSFTLRIPIRSSPKAIYEAWATQQGLESWFLRFAQYTKPDGSIRAKTDLIQPGDEYNWLWYGYKDEVVEKREVLAANGWDKLQFRFSGDCIVTVQIQQQGGENICQLTQEMPMDEESSRQYYFVECGRGWTFYLANLKSILEGGLDLRNRDINLHPVFN